DGIEDSKEKPVVKIVDSDNDGLSDDIEKKLGTDPNDPNDVPAVTIKYEYDARGSIKRAASFITK
ncbi:MAG: hypothetical protein GY718_00015, partial [Lentisphaerae bacterium]|nr:hypothetical protein [Lentisphaerota bacterium]